MAVVGLLFTPPLQSLELKAMRRSPMKIESPAKLYAIRALSFSCTTSPRSARTSCCILAECHVVSAVADIPTVSDTKLRFLKAYNRPIPSIYNTVLQELIVQQHLRRYKHSYHYDAISALGLVTLYDQLMEGYPSDEHPDAIFEAFLKSLNEDPDRYRSDALKLQEWACAQTASGLMNYASRNGDVGGILKAVGERAGVVSYSRFFAVGLFRILQLADALQPVVLEKLCGTFKVDKRCVERDLDLYRNLLSKLCQSKELHKEYVEREKKKQDKAQYRNATAAAGGCLGWKLTCFMPEVPSKFQKDLLTTSKE